jgi:hypothetical protein
LAWKLNQGLALFFTQRHKEHGEKPRITRMARMRKKGHCDDAFDWHDLNFELARLSAGVKSPCQYSRPHDAMKCPNCNHEFMVTMGQYLREPRGRHKCPSCGTKFRLVYSFSYFAMLLVAELVLAGGPALLMFYFSRQWLFAAITFAVCLVIFVVPLDLWLDNKWRPSAQL